MTSNIIVGKALQEEYNKQIIEELKKIKEEFLQIARYEYIGPDYIEEVFNKHISELKGE